MAGTGQLYHFKCPECEFDDKEAGQLASESQIYCGLCFADNNHLVVLHRWPATLPVAATVGEQ